MIFFFFQAQDGIRDVAVTGVHLFVPSRRRHTRCSRDWSSDVCSSDLPEGTSVQRCPFVKGERIGICSATNPLQECSLKVGGAQAYPKITDIDTNSGRIRLTLEGFTNSDQIGRASCRERV